MSNLHPLPQSRKIRQLRFLISSYGFVVEHDEIMFVKTNEMNDPALIQQAYSCHKINSSKRFAIALMEI
jgi:hypothetical protein